MSHHKEREEKICLNCGAEMHGRYCHKCGQENTHPQESFWHLVTHFVYDVTHFDGKFFSTLKYLLFKPGYLPAEYLKGRRTSYLHPIRMYVFTSAIFFVIFLSFVVKTDEVGQGFMGTHNKPLDKVKQEFIDTFYTTRNREDKLGMIQALNAVGGLNGELVHMDSAHHDSIASRRYVYIDTGHFYRKVSFKSAADSLAVVAKEAQEKNDNWDLTLNDEKLPNTMEEYDSAQAKLPKEKRDGWFKTRFNKKAIEIADKFRHDPDGTKKELSDHFLHSIPKMMFVSVPFVALILQLLYVRRRKTFYYVNHVIFIIYLYIAAFISLLVYFGFNALYDVTKFAPFNWLAILVMIYIVLYGLVGMHNFYKQGWFKSFVKYFILLFVCSILSAFIIAIFFITSVIQI